MIQYRTVVSWDTSLVDVGFTDASVSSGLKGLACEAIKITAGTPQANAGYFIPSAKIYNAADGTEYRNTGSTSAPVWSLVETSGAVPGSTIAFNSDATAGPITISAAEMVDAILSRDGGSADRSDTTDTAAAIIAAIPGAVVNSAFVFYLQNISATPGQKITLLAGSGVTLNGVENVYAGGQLTVVGRVTNVGTPAVSLYGVTASDAIAPAVDASSSVNTVQYSTGATNHAPSYTAVGSDTNIGLKLVPKGTGVVSTSEVVAAKASNFTTDTGANNALTVALLDADGVAVPLAAGLRLTIQLAHTLQAGANTITLNGAGGAKSLKSHFNVANDIATAYAATGVIEVEYNGTLWVDLSQ